ncbi:hypothetical protein [Glaciimonas immobilis]|uniref:Uncharacterized protein n=1 Tax=Glaciimonas immobilis TaxID=728004 RepID=A0A840RTF4_9BURK|nr:hypothetical protein [Glaciimonas immobilis]MBB5200442.1 hypothetical protein [Glaciimonas immobilis]
MSKGFLFVTGAFDFTDTGFATVLDALFFVGVAAALETALGAALTATLGANFVVPGLITFGLGVFPAVLLSDWIAVVSVGWTVEECADNFVAVGFTFLVELVWGFAGFFIAVAMESFTKLVTLHYTARCSMMPCLVPVNIQLIRICQLQISCY